MLDCFWLSNALMVDKPLMHILEMVCCIAIYCIGVPAHLVIPLGLFYVPQLYSKIGISLEFISYG